MCSVLVHQHMPGRVACCHIRLSEWIDVDVDAWAWMPREYECYICHVPTMHAYNMQSTNQVPSKQTVFSHINPRYYCVCVYL